MELDDDDYVEEDDVDFEGDPTAAESSSSRDAPKNKFLVASKQDHGVNSFVLRGSEVGVFHRDHDLLRASGSMIVRDTDGAAFTPHKAALHNSESSLLLHHPEQLDTMFNMDLSTGQIVEEFSAVENYSLRAVVPETKFGQLQPSSVLNAVTPSGLFKLDLRLNSKDKAAMSQSQIYKSNPDLTCMATTESGDIAVGSMKGDIRLYSSNSLKRAKTLLPGLGDPIISLDTTSDGKWVLATTNTYLLVVPTTLPDSDQIGFRARMGQQKPQPLKLQLRAQDLRALQIPNVRFTPARFDTPDEESIVTSTHSFLITWNFRKVKRGLLQSYAVQEIVAQSQSRQESQIAIAEPLHNSKNIVLAVPNNVYSQKRGSRR